METLDNISDIICDVCQDQIFRARDLNLGFVYLGREQNTGLGGTYKVDPTPRTLKVCENCCKKLKNKNLLLLVIALVGGFVAISLFALHILNIYSLYVGLGIFGLIIWGLTDSVYKKKDIVDRLALFAFHKKYKSKFDRDPKLLFLTQAIIDKDYSVIKQSPDYKKVMAEAKKMFEALKRHSDVKN